MTTVNQKRIAINTLLLYFRMIVVMLVGLYTSRVIIDALGQEHFGIYDAVGGIVLMASFISSTMSGACQRYYSYELGRGNSDGLKMVFNISLTVFFIITILIIILAETAGYWFLIHKMDVAGHTQAAQWVFQFSIIAFAFVILRLPYQGMVIAKEKMKVFAYLSLFEAFATLATAILLSHTPDNKDNRLILYSGLMTGIQLITTLFYWVYCRLFYAECRIKLSLDREKFKELFAYAGWNMIGSCSDVFERVGLNILLNVTFGPIISAARAVANKVFNTITQLNTNFYTAVRPQLYKSYASDEMVGMHKLMCQSTKFSFFLLLILALPILLETDFILPIWLRGRNVPEQAYIFTKLMVIEGLLFCFSDPLSTAVQATGNIKYYKIVIGGTYLFVLPLSYIGVTYLKFPPASVFVITIIFILFIQAERLWFVKKLVQLNLKMYLKTAVQPIIFVTLISTALSIIIKMWMKSISFNNFWIGHLIVILSSMCLVCFSVCLFGMNNTERKHIMETALSYLVRKKTVNND